jgi:2,4-dienoyl-CoA reductase-like NADH-dependent reductase (Old Yellow Enzyme family)
MRRYYGTFARGGFGIVITEGTYIDTDASQGYDRQPGIATAPHAKAWSPIAEEIRSAGAIAIMQLMHAGALSQRTTGRTVAPSSIQPRGQMMPEYGGDGPYRRPTTMTARDIRAVRQGFVKAAIRARDAGFDGVEIHAANGYLLDQFNTSYTNRRTDRYGGTPQNRIRLTAEIVEATRTAVGEQFILGVRLSEAKVNDFEYRWPGGPDEAATIFATLAGVGAGYLHVAGEGRGFRDALDGSATPLTTLARQVARRPVIANGGLGDAALAEAVIKGSYADLVSIGRAALVNPDWPQRIARGESLETFAHEMLSPSASLKNSDRWLRERGQAA